MSLLAKLMTVFNRTQPNQSPGKHGSATTPLRQIKPIKVRPWTLALLPTEESDVERRIRSGVEALHEKASRRELGGPDILNECLNAFLRHDDVTCATHALVLMDGTGKASLPVMQMLLISLQQQHSSVFVAHVGSAFLEATINDPWDHSLIELILGRASREDVLKMAHETKQKAAARYYGGVRLRIEGQVELARKEFNMCPINEPCIESSFAINELKPEIVSKNIAATRDRLLCRPMIHIPAV